MALRTFFIIFFGFMSFCLTACGSTIPQFESDTSEVFGSEKTSADDSKEAFDSEGALSDSSTLAVATSEAIVDINEDHIPVYVCGAVNNPGVYYVSTYSIKEDLLDLAGGFCEGANETYVNLAETVSSGEKIYFPFIDEDIIESNSNDKISLGNESSSEKININKASMEELMTLPGIGRGKATDIISYREANGDFTDVSEIKNVAGIKEGVYNKIKDYIDIR